MLSALGAGQRAQGRQQLRVVKAGQPPLIRGGFCPVMAVAIALTRALGILYLA